MSNQPTSPIKVLLADDHLVVRMGLSAIISLQDDMTVVGEADNGLSALELARSRRPDVVIMDLMMPQMNGVEATKAILEAFPETRILVLTTYGSSEDTRAALDWGAAGALVKDSSQEDILGAIRAVAGGGRVVSPEIQSAQAEQPEQTVLSDRQVQILRYAARGYSNREIGKVVHVGTDCVKAHLKTIFARLGVTSRTEAVATAFRKRLLRT